MSSIFKRPDSYFKRNLDKIGVYIRQSALYLHKRTGRPMQECFEYVKMVTGPGGKFQLFNPRVEYIDGKSEGNRKLAYTTMLDYMAETEDRNEIMAATFTTYCDPHHKKSMIAKYVDREYKGRAANKKTSAEYTAKSEIAEDVAEAAQFKLLGNIYHNRQNRNKVKLNSISGGHASKSSALFCASAHQTLTSTTRTGTSNTNATLERFLMGNRHYYNYEVTIQNIVAMLDVADMDAVTKAVDHHGLHKPTVDECYEHCIRSTDLYWRTNTGVKENNIRALFESMTDYERACWLYTHDFWALRKYNEKFTREIFDLMLSESDNTPRGNYRKIEDTEFGLLGITLNNVLQFRKLKDVDENASTIVHNTHEDILNGLEAYRLYFNAFWLCRNMPHCVSKFPLSIRRTAIASDTDSAIFTSQDWVEWYCGHMDMGPLGASVAAVTVYFCSHLVSHVLAAMMRNYGAPDEYIREFIMKNEFLFKFFCLTTMAKHYYGAMVAQEGNVYKKPKWEIKGATLKNSKADKEVMDKSDGLIKTIGETVMDGKELYFLPILQEVANYERKLLSEIHSGNDRFFRNGQVKSADSYKNVNSMYLQYTLWEDVFAPKYGSVPPPPYSAINVNIDCNSRAKVFEWLDNLEDRDFAGRMEKWLQKYKKHNGIKALWLPKEKVAEIGIPKEVLAKINDREMVLALMKSYYLILESLGYYTLNKNITRLISDDL